MRATRDSSILRAAQVDTKSQLSQQHVGKHISTLRTPALLIDRDRFAKNCQRLYRDLTSQGLKVRVHVKTHKTAEGTRLQVDPGVRAVIASTLPEVWGVIEEGLVEEGKVDDILYALPVDASKLEELAEAQEACGTGTVRVMVDHADQIAELDAFNKRRGTQRRAWSVFCKVDGGGRRAGAPPESKQMQELIRAALASPEVEVYGFYSHFGQSYGSQTQAEADAYYQAEIDCVNRAAKVARSSGVQNEFVLSVGATPTALAAAASSSGQSVIPARWEGRLEVHAGCYCMLDLQQLAVGIARPEEVSISILARVVSVYADRNEAMCDAGALAVSKDVGQVPGYGQVISPAHCAAKWDLGRVSQEHGTLVHRPRFEGKLEEESAASEDLAIGELIKIVPQHACLACACFPWYYVVRNATVEDIWVPWRGW